MRKSLLAGLVVLLACSMSTAYAEWAPYHAPGAPYQKLKQVTSEKLSKDDFKAWIKYYNDKTSGPIFDFIGIHQEGNKAAAYYFSAQPGSLTKDLNDFNETVFVRLNSGEWICPSMPRSPLLYLRK